MQRHFLLLFLWFSCLGVSAKAYAHTKAYVLTVNYRQQHVKIRDSLSIEDPKNKTIEIESKYQSESKHDSILVLQKNNQLQQLELQKKKTLNTALIAGCILLSLIVGLVYRNFKHRHNLLKQEKIIQAQQIAEFEKEQQFIVMQSVMKGQEDERSRLARDLHDGVGSLLAGVKLSLSAMKRSVSLPGKCMPAVEQIITQLDQSIVELRRVSHNMMPESLIKYGLKEALENYCENINLSGSLKVRLQNYGMETRLEQNTEIIIYRIIQELLNNAIKHAEAKNILIQLMKSESRFELTVEDDGKGFDRNDFIHKNGSGLANIQARTAYLGGKIDIQSRLQEGTSVYFELITS